MAFADRLKLVANKRLLQLPSFLQSVSGTLRLCPPPIDPSTKRTIPLGRRASSVSFSAPPPTTKPDEATAVLSFAAGITVEKLKIMSPVLCGPLFPGLAFDGP